MNSEIGFYFQSNHMSMQTLCPNLNKSSSQFLNILKNPVKTLFSRAFNTPHLTTTLDIFPLKKNTNLLILFSV